jgi:translation initiation factor IF-3
MDFGKYKYEQSKKTHTMKLHQKTKLLKEVKLRPYTEEHDLQFKVSHIRRFLEDGNKSKVTVAFKGREMNHLELGRNLLDKVVKAIEDIGKVELPPKLEGRNMVMVIIPK